MTSCWMSTPSLARHHHQKENLMVVTSDGVDKFGISFTKQMLKVHVVAFFFKLMLDANRSYLIDAWSGPLFKRSGRPSSRYDMKGGPSDIPGGPRLWVGGGGGLYFYKYKNNLDSWKMYTTILNWKHLLYNRVARWQNYKTSTIASEKQHNVVPNIKTHLDT